MANSTIIVKITQIAGQVFYPLYAVYDFIYAKNPVTKHRAFWIIPSCVERAVGYIFDTIVMKKFQQLMTGMDLGNEIASPHQAMLEKVGNRLLAQAERTDVLNFQFNVVNSPVFNAWSIPGGKICMTEQAFNALCLSEKLGFLVAELSSSYIPIIIGYEDITYEDKVAAIISHEIIHASGRHYARLMEKYMPPSILVGILLQYCFPFLVSPILSLSAFYFICRIIINLLNVSMCFRFLFGLMRSHEYEADKYGIELMQKAGYNPRAHLWLQEFFIVKEDPDYSLIDYLKSTCSLFTKIMIIIIKLELFIMPFDQTHPSPRLRLEENKKTLRNLNINTDHLGFVKGRIYGCLPDFIKRRIA